MPNRSSTRCPARTRPTRCSAGGSPGASWSRARPHRRRRRDRARDRSDPGPRGAHPAPPRAARRHAAAARLPGRAGHRPPGPWLPRGVGRAAPTGGHARRGERDARGGCPDQRPAGRRPAPRGRHLHQPGRARGPDEGLEPDGRGHRQPAPRGRVQAARLPSHAGPDRPAPDLAAAAARRTGGPDRAVGRRVRDPGHRRRRGPGGGRGARLPGGRPAAPVPPGRRCRERGGRRRHGPGGALALRRRLEGPATADHQRRPRARHPAQRAAARGRPRDRGHPGPRGARPSRPRAARRHDAADGVRGHGHRTAGRPRRAAGVGRRPATARRPRGAARHRRAGTPDRAAHGRPRPGHRPREGRRGPLAGLVARRGGRRQPCPGGRRDARGRCAVTAAGAPRRPAGQPGRGVPARLGAAVRRPGPLPRPGADHPLPRGARRRPRGGPSGQWAHRCEQARRAGLLAPAADISVARCVPTIFGAYHRAAEA